jgi:RecQ family ATP-dependent DNA helicase
LELRKLREDFPEIPILGVSASVNGRVIADIIFQLNLRKTQIFQLSFNRPNLIFNVVPKNTKTIISEIVKIIKASTCSAIVYATTRKDCEIIANKLTRFGISCKPYHAGLNPLIRSKNQKLWMDNQIQVMVATCAFGLGIDKSDVGTIIHFSLPSSPDAYIQECGRGGRDGRPVKCYLFYSKADVLQLKSMISKSPGDLPVLQYQLDNMCRMKHYAETTFICRRQLNLLCLDEIRDFPCNLVTEEGCDNCLNLKATKKKDISKISIRIFHCLDVLEEEELVTLKSLHSVLWGIKSDCTVLQIQSLTGILSSWHQHNVENLIQHLLIKGFLILKHKILQNKTQFSGLFLNEKTKELLKTDHCNIKIELTVLEKDFNSLSINDGSFELLPAPASQLTAVVEPKWRTHCNIGSKTKCADCCV